MSDYQRRFSELLDDAALGRSDDALDQSDFKQRCRNRFAPLAAAMGEVAAEVEKRGIGTVKLANPTPSADRFEIIYNLQRKGQLATSLTFRFLENDPEIVELYVGPSNRESPKRISIDNPNETLEGLLRLLASYFS
jgi:hypothetical protein